MSVPPIGVAGVHVEPGDRPLTSEEFERLSGIPASVVERKLGFKRLVKWGEVGMHKALVKACGQALGGLDPRKVDVLITILSPPHLEAEVYGYGQVLKDRIGATNAEVLDVNDACASSCLALQLARDLMLAEPHVNNVLVAGMLAVEDAIDFANPGTTWVANISDGAGAVLVQRNPDLDNVILETAQHTDPSFVDDVVFSPQDARYGTITHRTRYRGYATRRIDVVDKDDMKRRLDPVALPAFVKPIHESLARSGLQPRDMDMLGANHMKPSLWRGILDHLQLEQSKQIYLDENGHMSFLDQYIYLQRIRQERRLPEGGVVVLASPGIGFLWAATTIVFKGPRTEARLR
jgi:3-oxoacyl-[acyl-carrier-protein] synthase III